MAQNATTYRVVEDTIRIFVVPAFLENLQDRAEADGIWVHSHSPHAHKQVQCP
eukprot:CAMPEP_0185780606 /NCGR_PEP_ID=MMETSP1174-20130828/99645_1 /TAXON_ID=35687 /ORGANISM="Dictyocha speculum, Strain CCMP1381" /LENGTH=52 /DNA_ID=CAMNT_0028470233 /DNA_START=497 /DNA_END=652 /DNA_ORIENTATION=+